MRSYAVTIPSARFLSRVGCRDNLGLYRDLQRRNGPVGKSSTAPLSVARNRPSEFHEDRVWRARAQVNAPDEWDSDVDAARGYRGPDRVGAKGENTPLTIQRLDLRRGPIIPRNMCRIPYKFALAGRGVVHAGLRRRGDGSPGSTDRRRV